MQIILQFYHIHCYNNCFTSFVALLIFQSYVCSTVATAAPTASDYLLRSIEDCSWEPKILIPTNEQCFINGLFSIQDTSGQKMVVLDIVSLARFNALSLITPSQLQQLSYPPTAIFRFVEFRGIADKDLLIQSIKQNAFSSGTTLTVYSCNPRHCAK